MGQEYRSIISEGFSAIIHLHTAVEEVKIQRLLGKFNRKTKKMEKFTGAKFLKQGDQGICRFKLNNMVAMDKAIRQFAVCIGLSLCLGKAWIQGTPYGVHRLNSWELVSWVVDVAVCAWCRDSTDCL